MRGFRTREKGEEVLLNALVSFKMWNFHKCLESSWMLKAFGRFQFLGTFKSWGAMSQLCQPVNMRACFICPHSCIDRTKPCVMNTTVWTGACHALYVFANKSTLKNQKKFSLFLVFLSAEFGSGQQVLAQYLLLLRIAIRRVTLSCSGSMVFKLSLI